ncbi:MAG: hypothetical protein JNM78_15385 [Cyclobacteriaceae bacterium]|nr:hypothetical protein [Cyclobacteriaceae bacterium]
MRIDFKVLVLLAICVGLFALKVYYFLSQHYQAWTMAGRDNTFFNQMITFDSWASYAEIVVFAFSAIGVFIKNKVGWIMTSFGLYSFATAYAALPMMFLYNGKTKLIGYELIIIMIIFSLLIFIFKYLTNNREVKAYYRLEELTVSPVYNPLLILAGIGTGLFIEVGRFYLT